ncbi:hypothetical protein [Paenibacillus sp. FSL H8-0259]|uniref:hypothetical protein n=1 Tax=Paenibacillus sp. FSL H8-0259 TaxID=1920423 RepID=UPI00096D9BD8|nr:hypothetical protein [Paenibacillus sp. FSL H8-0259]OMF26979.1 hypothetical protein BK132_18775 [Paenibacillus sp. FSL H8-0259]
MRKYRVTYAALLVSTLVAGQLAGSITAPVAAAAATSKNAAAPAAAPAFKFNSVPLGAGVTAVLENVNIWSQTGGNIVSYTLKYTNSGNSSASLLKYFSRVVTPGGSVLPGNPVGTDALKKKVGAKESLSVTYYVNVGQTSSLQGLKISMHVWDAKAKGYLKQTGSYAVPANYSTAAAAGTSLNTTMNDIPVTASADSLQLYKYGGKVYAKVGLNLTNKGNKVLGDPGYSAYLVSASGTSFELALSSTQADYKIQPQEKRSIYYLAEIPAYLKTDNMKLQFTQKDETTKLELPKSAYKLPAATSPNLVVGSGVVKKIIVNSNTIETLIRNANVYSQDADAVWTFQMQIKNTGNKAVTLPSYELAVKSQKGTTFPVSAKGLSGVTLKPLETKIIPLTVRVPLEVEQSGLQLLMIEAVGADNISGPDSSGTSEGAGTTGTPGTPAPASPVTATTKMIFPVAYFVIPYALRADVMTGQEYMTTNSYGSFSYSIQSLQRYPWRDDDIVAARLRITNTQTVSLTIPELKGSIKLDNDSLPVTTELYMDNKESSVLAPGKSVELYVLGKIAYTSEFRDMRVALYGTQNSESVPFLDLSVNNSINSIPTIAQGKSYTISKKGKAASLKENKTTVYEGENYNLVYTELLLSSEEKRQSKMARLQAYYKTKDGQYFEASSSQSDNSASPGAKQLVVFWTKLPKAADIADISLYLGAGINGGKLIESKEEATGFVDVAALQLNPQGNVPATTLASTVLYPYTISVQSSEGKHLRSSDTLDITINYGLKRDNQYDAGALEHKLILQITDPFGISTEKTLTLGTDLTEGTNNQYSLSISRTLYKTMGGGAYSLTFYDEFQGERIKLGSQAYAVTNVNPVKPEE